MRVLIVTAGSHGDVNPFISVGRELRRRGHEATILVNPYYQHQVEEAGVGFAPLGERMDLKRLDEEFPDVMHPRKGAKVVVEQLLIPTSVAAFHRVRELAAVARPDVVLTHCICPGAAWACEGLRIPCAHAVLSPLNWVSREEPLLVAAWSPLDPPRWLRLAVRAIMLPVMSHTFDPALARVRRQLGLPRRRQLIMDAMRGGALNLALWSPHLRGPLSDDPATGVICGFPWHDAHGEVEALPADVQRFMDAGDPPILFCLGTAAVHVAGDFYECAAEACRILGRRGLLLVGPGRPAPGNMPQGVRAFAYAPFSTVMPQCAVNVHHGGVGSTGQAMRAGRPTVVIPHAHDQWDNAGRLVRLGISRTLPRPKVTGVRLAAALRQLLADPAIESRAAQVGRQMASEDGAAAAADQLEALVQRTHAPAP